MTNYNSTIRNSRQKLIDYVITQVKGGYYPTREEIEQSCHTNLKTHGLKIRKLYKLADIKYKREPNPFLRYRKEKQLTEIIKKLFIKLEYHIKRISIGPAGRGGADIILENKKRELIPVEIKAYHKSAKLGADKHAGYYRNELLQLQEYIQKTNAPYGYLVTTTDRKTFQKQPSKTRIIFGQKLKRLLLRFKMKKELKKLLWIRNSHISNKKTRIKRRMRSKILCYVKRNFTNGRYVSKRNIQKKLKINLYTYFTSMGVLYQKLGINAIELSHFRMGRNFKKETVKKKILQFIKRKAKENKRPTYKEIQGRFHCLPSLFFPDGIREIYKTAKVPYKRKFAVKTLKEKHEIKQEILQYVRTRLESEHRPTYREIKSKFKIGVEHYFKNLEAIYNQARNYEMP